MVSRRNSVHSPAHRRGEAAGQRSIVGAHHSNTFRNAETSMVGHVVAAVAMGSSTAKMAVGGVTDSSSAFVLTFASVGSNEMPMIRPGCMGRQAAVSAWGSPSRRSHAGAPRLPALKCAMRWRPVPWHVRGHRIECQTVLPRCGYSGSGRRQIACQFHCRAASEGGVKSPRIRPTARAAPNDNTDGHKKLKELKKAT